MTNHTHTLTHTEADIEKGYKLAAILEVDLDNSPLVCSWIRDLTPTNPAATLLAAAWTDRHPGFYMGNRGIVISTSF